MDQVTESRLAAAQAGAQGLSNELLAGQEVSIINRLVDAHRRDKLTPQVALTGIATISELRSLRAKMTRAVQLGAEAAESITRPRRK